MSLITWKDTREFIQILKLEFKDHNNKIQILKSKIRAKMLETILLQIYFKPTNSSCIDDNRRNGRQIIAIFDDCIDEKQFEEFIDENLTDLPYRVYLEIIRLCKNTPEFCGLVPLLDLVDLIKIINRDLELNIALLKWKKQIKNQINTVLSLKGMTDFLKKENLNLDF